jgi:hypothetical protein
VDSMNNLCLDYCARSNALRRQSDEGKLEARLGIRHCSHHNRRVAFVSSMEVFQDLVQKPEVSRIEVTESEHSVNSS